MRKATSPSLSCRLRLPTVLIGGLGAGLLGYACSASAQSYSGSSSQFNSGYGGSDYNRMVNVRTRDDNNNQIFINGRLTTPRDSIFSQSTGVSRTGGVGGAGVATAIGNNLTVVVQGSWNRVVVDSTQINNADVSAQTSLNGSVDLK